MRCWIVWRIYKINRLQGAPSDPAEKAHAVSEWLRMIVQVRAQGSISENERWKAEPEFYERLSKALRIEAEGITEESNDPLSRLVRTIEGRLKLARKVPGLSDGLAEMKERWAELDPRYKAEQAETPYSLEASLAAQSADRGNAGRDRVTAQDSRNQEDQRERRINANEREIGDPENKILTASSAESPPGELGTLNSERQTPNAQRQTPNADAERGRLVGHAKTVLKGHSADLAFGGLTVVQLLDAWRKGDAKGVDEAKANATVLAFAAGGPIVVREGLSAFGASKALAGGAGALTALGFGGYFTWQSGLGTVEAWGAYGRAAQEAKKLDAQLAGDNDPGNRQELETSLREARQWARSLTMLWAGMQARREPGGQGRRCRKG